METTTTLINSLKKEESAITKSDCPLVIQEEIYSENELNYEINEVISQIKNTSEILKNNKNISEEESNKLAFYSFLKFLAKKQNIEIKIVEYDSLLEEFNPNFNFNFNYFLNRIDFLEKVYSKIIPMSYKKNYGQFFTPLNIAEFMVEIGLTKEAFRVLDPATGGSIFTSIMLKKDMKSANYTLIEKDLLCQTMSKLNLSRFKDGDVRHINSDFLNFETGKYDLIISNPPYIRFHEISNREETIRGIEEEVNIPLSRLTNYYALFFFHANKLLKDNGKLIFITPSEFLNANYGISLREFFKKNFEIETIITFDKGALIFEDGLSTACITVLTKKLTPDKNKISKLIKLKEWIGKEKLLNLMKTSSESISNDEYSINLIKQSDLNYKEKWNKYFLNNDKYEKIKHNLIKLSDIAKVSRGIATGANEFFILSRDEMNKLGLEQEFLKLVIEKSTYCKYTSFTKEDFETILTNNKPAYLIYCFSDPSINLKRYIEHGEKLGFNKRYLNSKRNPWYAMEKREIAPIWVGTFNRDGVRFILNETSCLNLTTFHGIYPKFKDRDKLLFITAFLNSKHSSELIKREVRSMGGGLDKLQPKDINNLLIPNIELINPEIIKRISKLFASYLDLERKSEDFSEIKKNIEEEFEIILTKTD